MLPLLFLLLLVFLLVLLPLFPFLLAAAVGGGVGAVGVGRCGVLKQLLQLQDPAAHKWIKTWMWVGVCETGKQSQRQTLLVGKHMKAFVLKLWVGRVQIL